MLDWVHAQYIKHKPKLISVGELLVLRGLITLVGAAATIWVSRCLGAHELGISATVQSIGFQLYMLLHLNQDTALLRDYKGAQDETARVALLEASLSFRALILGGLILVLSIVFGVGLASNTIPEDWRLALLCLIPLVIAGAFPSNWILYAQGRQKTDLQIAGLTTVLLLIGYGIFIRPGSHAGENLLILAVVQTLTVGLAWAAALRGRHKLRLSLASAKRYLPILGKGKWLLVAGLVGLVHVYYAAPLLAVMVSEKEAGYYKAAEQLVSAINPFLLLVSIFIYPQYVGWKDQSVAFVWGRQIRYLFIGCTVGLILLVIGSLAAHHVIPLALGQQFQPAVIPFSLLLGAKIVATLGGIFSWWIYARGDDRFMLVAIAIGAATSLAANYLLIPRMGSLGAATTSLLVEILIFAVVFGDTLRRRRAAGAVA